LREKKQLNFIAIAVDEAKSLGADGEDLLKLTQLSNALFSKIDLPGTKAQLKPVYSKRQAGQVRRLTKLTLVFKWWVNPIFSKIACPIFAGGESSRTRQGTNLATWEKT
jgi:hypothetical protein